jgi:hypothetical protein
VNYFVLFVILIELHSAAKLQNKEYFTATKKQKKHTFELLPMRVSFLSKKWIGGD